MAWTGEAVVEVVEEAEKATVEESLITGEKKSL